MPVQYVWICPWISVTAWEIRSKHPVLVLGWISEYRSPEVGIRAPYLFLHTAGPWLHRLCAVLWAMSGSLGSRPARQRLKEGCVLTKGGSVPTSPSTLGYNCKNDSGVRVTHLHLLSGCSSSSILMTSISRSKMALSRPDGKKSIQRCKFSRHSYLHPLANGGISRHSGLPEPWTWHSW